MTSGRRLLQHRTVRLGAAALILLGLTGAALAKPKNPLRLADTQYVPITWIDIDGWVEDDQAAAFATFMQSCKAILRGTQAMRDTRPMYGALYDVCRKAAETKPKDAKEAREFFERHFRPVRISPLGTPDGFLTGYYEPIVEGTRKETDEHVHPLYRKPPNLLPGGRMAIAAKATTSKGKKRSRRVLVPYHDRAAIDDGVLAGRGLEICWLKDPIDSFFIHIQGSVRVKLDDGKLMRLNYVAQNGHPYVAVGKFLIERKIVPKEEMSMRRIRQWMEANPEEGKALRRKNKSYVFFRDTGLAANEEPIGAQGVSLTPDRSIAVDRNLHIYGTPFFISGELPIESEQPTTKFRKLMVAQDTGGAIIGPARADIYFGAGDTPADIAGRMRHPGRFVMLVPNAVDPWKPKGDIPLPRPKPSAEVMAAVQHEPEKSTAKAQPKPANIKKKEAAVRPAKTAKTVKRRKPKS
jgi:membrane-bound lytic murein transglycosylase A